MLRTALLATGLALAGGLGTLAVNATAPASAQEEFRVTAEQMKINQRISQAAVRRSNEALALLAPVRPAPAPPTGWPGEAIRDGGITSGKLAEGAVTEAKIAPDTIGPSRLSPGVREALAGPAFAIVEADGAIRRADDGSPLARGVPRALRNDVGSYGVYLSGTGPCAITVSVEAQQPLASGSAVVGGPWLGTPPSPPPPGNPQQPPRVLVPVYTFAADGSPADRAFHVVGTCN